MPLVSFFHVNHTRDAGNSRTALQGLNLACNLRNALSTQRAGGCVRGDSNFGVPPERMCGWQWLLPEDIQRRTGQMPAVDQADQIIIHQMRTTRHVDDVSASQQLRQMAVVQNVFIVLLTLFM